MLRVSVVVAVVVAVVVVGKVVAIIVVVVDLALVAIAGFSLPLTKDRFEFDRESLFEGGTMSGYHGNGNDLKKVMNLGEMFSHTK